MTYGALVVQLIQDYEDYAEVNKQLEKMGYNIGTRLIEDFLARSNLGRCTDFKETGEVIAKATFSLSLSPLPCRLTGSLCTGRIQVISERLPHRHALATAARLSTLEHSREWAATATATDGRSVGDPATLHAYPGREPVDGVC